MLKNLLKKINRRQEPESTDLNMDYDGFYSGKSERPVDRSADRSAEGGAETRPASGYYDAPQSSRGYVEPDFRSDNSRYYDGPAERPVERGAEQPVESFVRPRETYNEPEAAQTAPVFTPAPAPEYLYFTPATYGDCRSGIVKGLADGHVVVIRMRNLEKSDMFRLFDYMMGAVEALNASFLRYESATVVLLPDGVELDEDEILSEDEDEDEYDEDYDEDEEYEEDEYEEDEYEEDEYEEEEEEEDDGDEYEEEYEDEAVIYEEEVEVLDEDVE